MYPPGAATHPAALRHTTPQDHLRRRCDIRHRHAAAAGHRTHPPPEAADLHIHPAAEAAQEGHIPRAEAIAQDHPPQELRPPLHPLPHPLAEAPQAEEGKRNRCQQLLMFRPLPEQQE